MLDHVGLNGTTTRARFRVQRSERYIVFRCVYISYLLHISGLQFRLDDPRSNELVSDVSQTFVLLLCQTCICF